VRSQNQQGRRGCLFKTKGLSSRAAWGGGASGKKEREEREEHLKDALKKIRFLKTLSPSIP
jgi:hypothetical protein